MAKDLDSVCKRLQAIASGLGVDMAPQYAKEQIIANTFAVSYPKEGTMDAEQVPATRGIHTVVTEIHYSVKAMEKAIQNSIPMIESFSKAALADPTLNGTCDTIVGPIKYKFGWLSWGGKKDNHIGPRFEVTVKIRATS